jgi:hypothetical protein
VYIDPTDPNPVGWTPTVNRRMEVA